MTLKMATAGPGYDRRLMIRWHASKIEVDDGQIESRVSLLQMKKATLRSVWSIYFCCDGALTIPWR